MSPKKRLFALILAATATLGAGGFASDPQQLSRTVAIADAPDPKRIEEMDSLLQSFIDEKKLGNAVGYVARRGQVLYAKAFGWKDVEKAVPASLDDYYVLMSQTKAVTSVAFMTLVEQGRVSIDDPVSKFFPQIPDKVVTTVREDGTYETRPVSTPMTFRHLLTHTSGLNAGLVREIRRTQRQGNDAPAGFGGAIPGKVPSGQHTGGGNPEAKYLEEEMLMLAKYPLGFDPGTQWNYHVSTNMLGYLIEKISGKPLRVYVKETVLDPLGMKETDWFYEPAALARFVNAYRVADGKRVLGPNLYSEGTVSAEQTYCEGAIGLNGPIEDYAKFCQMLLNKGGFNGRRILRAETVELMTTINQLPENSGAEAGFQFGLGFELHKTKKPIPAVSDRAFAWGGMMGTAYIIDPENEMIALLYTNMFGAGKILPPFLEKAYALFPNATKKDALAGAGEKSGVVVLENGGRGPHPAIATEDPTLPGMTIFRPRDLSAFGGATRLPILLWGNGACANTADGHKLFLNEIASHGYLVLAIGRLEWIHQRAPSHEPTSSRQLLTALDWVLGQNQMVGAVFHDKVDPELVAAMGMSCGGLQAIEISGDPRIRTTVVCNSGVLPQKSPLRGMPDITKNALLNYHTPVLYIMGGPSDIAYHNAMDDFARVQHVPIVMASLDVGHAGTYARPHGGEYTPVALAWLDWQLKGDKAASRTFLEAESPLRRDPAWSVQMRNFPEAVIKR